VSAGSATITNVTSLSATTHVITANYLGSTNFAPSQGTIASYTVIRVAPRAYTADVPYAVAVVKLKEGVSLLGRIVEIPLDKLAVGLPVRFRPLVKGDQTAVGFGPA